MLALNRKTETSYSDDLSSLAYTIDQIVEETMDRCDLLLQAQERPYLVNIHMLKDIKLAFTKGPTNIDNYDDELLLLKATVLPRKYATELKRLQKQLKHLRTLYKDGLLLINDLLRKQTEPAFRSMQAPSNIA